MDKKYEFMNETKEIDGRILHRIVATKDFYNKRLGTIKKGTIGGFIESEENLCHKDGSWVMNHSCVYENAHIVGDALVGGCAHVHENSLVYGNAQVHGDAQVYGNARVYENAKVSGNARVCENAWVYGDAQVYGNAWAHGDAQVTDNVLVCENAKVSGNARVYENAKVSGNAWVSGNAHICENADISSDDDYAVVSGFGSKNRTTTFFLLSNKKVLVSCGCFIGYLDEFRAKVLETHGDTPLCQEYLMIADLMEMRFKRVLESKEEK